MQSNEKPLDKLVLGIDPGTRITGYSLISGNRNCYKLHHAGIIKLDARETHFDRLKVLVVELNKLINSFRPDVLAIEAPFYGKNVQSMLKLGRAQGVAITLALQYELPVFEYAPKKVKSALTGNGNASKDQVARMLQQVLQLSEIPAQMDQSDAMAVAICHLSRNRMEISNDKVSGWKAFIQNNPDRVARK